jgi:DNA-binding NtrC family response regulator
VAVLVDPEQVIEPGDIPLYDDVDGAATGTTVAQLDGPFHDVKDRVIAQFERDYLTRLVARASGNMSRAARQANIDRTTLYRLMEKHGLQRDGSGA